MLNTICILYNEAKRLLGSTFSVSLNFKVVFKNSMSESWPSGWVEGLQILGSNLYISSMQKPGFMKTGNVK